MPFDEAKSQDSLRDTGRGVPLEAVEDIRHRMVDLAFPGGRPSGMGATLRGLGRPSRDSEESP